MNTAAKRPTWIIRVGLAHKRLVISTAIGIAAVFVLRVTDLALVTRILLGWDTGVAIYLVWAATVMARCSTVAAIKRNAAIQDEGAFAILLLTVAAAIASLGAIFAELAALERANPNYGFHITLVVATVVLSWTFTHTIFALHYAHDFYGEASRSDGLKFPDNAKPDYWDFVYFSFVIGMTFQVSDVAVTNRAIRRMVVAHGALSFFFSTAIVALTVNIAAGLIQR
jgi:uncharacterized membrane protein